MGLLAELGHSTASLAGGPGVQLILVTPEQMADTLHRWGAVSGIPVHYTYNNDGLVVWPRPLPFWNIYRAGKEVAMSGNFEFKRN